MRSNRSSGGRVEQVQGVQRLQAFGVVHGDRCGDHRGPRAWPGKRDRARSSRTSTRSGGRSILEAVGGVGKER